MTKHQLLTPVVLIALALVSEAQAQVLFNTPDGPLMVRPHLGRAQPLRAPVAMVAPTAPGHYGGGFIELLMTGRDPGPGLRQASPNVQAGRHITAASRRPSGRYPPRRRSALSSPDRRL